MPKATKTAIAEMIETVNTDVKPTEQTNETKQDVLTTVQIATLEKVSSNDAAFFDCVKDGLRRGFTYNADAKDIQRKKNVEDVFTRFASVLAKAIATKNVESVLEVQQNEFATNERETRIKYEAESKAYIEREFVQLNSDEMKALVSAELKRLKAECNGAINAYAVKYVHQNEDAFPNDIAEKLRNAMKANLHYSKHVSPQAAVKAFTMIAIDATTNGAGHVLSIESLSREISADSFID